VTTRGGRVAVIGAGPAGMATALSVHQAGHEVLLLERYPRARPAGNILNLWPPPIKALGLLGVDIIDLGAPCHTEFRSVSGRTRVQVELPDEVIRSYVGGFIGLLRPDLYERLLAALPPGVLHVNHAVDRFEQDESGVRLHMADGEVIEADVLVGADGIDSLVRRILWGDAPKREHNLHILAGSRSTIPSRPSKPLRQWSKGRATIVGDAAHPTSPYAAYGAGMATEDGYFLGRRLAGTDLSGYAAVRQALQEFEIPRKPHTARQVQQAFVLGKLFHHAPPPLQTVRDAILDHTPFLQKVVGESAPGEILKQLAEIDAAEERFAAARKPEKSS